MDSTALLAIDVQEAFNERVALGHARNNPDAEANIARILQAFRQAGLPIFHIHHASTNPNSLFSPEKPGFAVQDFARPLNGERAIVKEVNSSFIGTPLEAELRQEGITTLAICGATTNHCVETTARMAGNLGFKTFLLRDACWTFEQTGIDGEHHAAQDVHQMSLSNLNGEFAEVVTVGRFLGRFNNG